MADLILGTVRNYSYSQIKPFLDSLFRTDFSGQVVFFVSGLSQTAMRHLRERGVELIPFSKNYPFLLDYNDVLPDLGLPIKYSLPLSLCTERFVMYYLYLNRYGQKYNRVMLTDVRDVIFQRNPFAFNDNDCLSVFLEDGGHKIADCLHNSGWIKQSFGTVVYEKIKDRNISCNGVVVGPVKLSLDYLRLKVDLIFRVGPPGIVGQGFHNYLIHTGKLPKLNIFTNESGPVLTMGLMSGYNHDKNSNLINQSGSVVNIVHQYDRHPELARRYYCRSAIWRGKLHNFKHWILSPLKKFPRFYYSLKIIYYRLWQK